MAERGRGVLECVFARPDSETFLTAMLDGFDDQHFIATSLKLIAVPIVVGYRFSGGIDLISAAKRA